MADTEKDVNRAAAAPQEEASAAQAAPEAPQPEAQDAEKPEKKEKHEEGKAHAELAALKTKLEQAEKKLAETKDTLLRTAAEYENFRKRSAREHDAAFDLSLIHILHYQQAQIFYGTQHRYSPSLWPPVR